MDPSKFNNLVLDEEEQEILTALHEGTIKIEPASDKVMAAAKDALKKDKSISIRINAHDLTSIKLIAAQEGIPYQTLIGSLIHKYTNGRFREIT